MEHSNIYMWGNELFSNLTLTKERQTFQPVSALLKAMSQLREMLKPSPGNMPLPLEIVFLLEGRLSFF